MNDMFNRSSDITDNDDVYLDTLREQAISLQMYNGNGLLNAPGSDEDLLKKYPSSKDLERRWTRVIPSRRGDDEDNEQKK
jgi:hypothetical protein